MRVIAALSQLVDAHIPAGVWDVLWLRKHHTHWNQKRIDRVYKVMKLYLKRTAKKRLLKREYIALSVQVRPNHVWSADCSSDALAGGRRFRCQRDR